MLGVVGGILVAVGTAVTAIDEIINKKEIRGVMKNEVLLTYGNSNKE
jgi:hypothetical protein